MKRFLTPLIAAAFAGKLYWLAGGLILVGCALTPSGLEWGADVWRDPSKIEDMEGPDLVDEVADAIREKNIAEGKDPDAPLGWRELAETVVGGGFLLNWLRNRKYQMVREPINKNKA